MTVVRLREVASPTKCTVNRYVFRSLLECALVAVTGRCIWYDQVYFLFGAGLTVTASAGYRLVQCTGPTVGPPSPREYRASKRQIEPLLKAVRGPLRTRQETLQVDLRDGCFFVGVRDKWVTVEAEAGPRWDYSKSIPDKQTRGSAGAGLIPLKSADFAAIATIGKFAANSQRCELSFRSETEPLRVDFEHQELGITATYVLMPMKPRTPS